MQNPKTQEPQKKNYQSIEVKINLRVYKIVKKQTAVEAVELGSDHLFLKVGHFLIITQHLSYRAMVRLDER